MPSITSLNSAFILNVTGLVAAPQPLQGYDVDDAFMADAIDVAETKIGVDGILSAGLINSIVSMSISLQADSVSNDLFETWYTAQRANGDIYFATGTIRLSGLGKTYSLQRGVLKNYTPFAAAKRVLQPRTFGIDWESIIGATLA